MNKRTSVLITSLLMGIATMIVGIYAATAKTATINSSISFTQSEAKIGTEYYQKLSQAFTAANETNDATIDILKNEITLDATITVSKKVTVKLASGVSSLSLSTTKTTLDQLFQINANGNLIFNASITFSTAKGKVFNIANSGTLTFSNGIANMSSENSDSIIKVNAGGTLNLGGTLPDLSAKEILKAETGYVNFSSAITLTNSKKLNIQIDGTLSDKDYKLVEDKTSSSYTLSNYVLHPQKVNYYSDIYQTGKNFYVTYKTGTSGLLFEYINTNDKPLGIQVSYGTATATAIVLPNLAKIGSDTPQEVKEVKTEGFKTKSLTSVTISPTIVDIKNNAFEDNLITSLAFAPNSKVQIIGDSAFSGSSNGSTNAITSLTISASVKTIGNYAFRYNKLSTLTFAANSQLETIGNYAFSGSSNGSTNAITSVAIPASVKTIGNYAFQYNKLSTLTFAANSQLETIGSSAFSGSSNGSTNAITSVAIPASVKTIGNYAFQYNKLSTLTFAANSQLETIGNSAFSGLSNGSTNAITSLTIPASVKTIGHYAFQYNKLSTLTFAANSQLETIGDSAFFGVSATNQLTSLEIPASVKTIGVYAFGGNKLSTLNFASGSQLTTIMEDAFTGNNLSGTLNLSNLTKLEYLNGFRLNKLTAITFPITSSFQTIGDVAFFGTSDGNAITSLTIPASVKTIGESAFQDNKLSTLTFAANSQLETIGDSAFRSNGSTNAITSLIIPASVITIESFAFGSNNLNTLIFANNSKLTTVGNNAFAFNNLTEILIPNNVKEIGRSAFDANSNLKVAVFAGNKIIGVDGSYGTDIFGSDYFSSPAINIFVQNADRASYQTKHDSVEFSSALGGVSIWGITSTYNASTGFTITAANIATPIANKALVLPTRFASGTNIGDLVGVTQFGTTGAFAKKGITSVVLPSTLKTIGNYTFDGSSDGSTNQINSVTIPKDVESIGNYAFRYNNLSSLSFVSGSLLKTIGTDAFAYNNLSGTLSLTYLTKLESLSGFRDNAITGITFPSTAPLATIGDNAFRGSSDGSTNQINSVTIPKSVESIGNSAFRYNNLSSLSFVSGSLLKTIGTDAFAYNNLSGTLSLTYLTKLESLSGFRDNAITGITFPSTAAPLATIGNDAFRGNGSPKTNVIASLAIPKSVTSIGSFAFAYNQLTSLSFVSGSLLTTIGESAFAGSSVYSNSNKISGNLTIPAGVTTIGNSAFAYNAITKLTFSGSVLTTIGNSAFAGSVGLLGTRNVIAGTLTIPSSVTSIGDSAFYANKITGLIFSGSALTTIGESAFTAPDGYTTNQITSVSIPTSVTSIGRNAFYGNKLAEILIPSNVKTIGASAFSSNTTLKVAVFAGNGIVGTGGSYGTTIFGSTVTNIFVPSANRATFQNAHSTNAFSSASGAVIASLTHSGSAAAGYTITGIASGSPINPSLVLPSRWANGSSIGNLVEVGDWAFYQKGLTGLTFVGSNLKKIRYTSFYKNTIAGSLTIPASVEEIGEWAFHGNSLTSLTFASGSQLTKIEGMAFENNSIGGSLTIPANVTSIGTAAFKDNYLTSLTFASGSQLTTIEIEAFRNNQLGNFTLPTSLITIGGRAFQNNSDKFTTLTVPANVETIGEYAFADNYKLSKAYFRGVKFLPSAYGGLTSSGGYGTDIFNGNHAGTLTLYGTNSTNQTRLQNSHNYHKTFKSYGSGSLSFSYGNP